MSAPDFYFAINSMFRYLHDRYGKETLVDYWRKLGKEYYSQRIANWRQGYQNSSGPIVAKGILIDGVDGCGRFVPESCFITGIDARTGKELWRTFTIAREGEPGGDTWGELPWELRHGGEVWIAATYELGPAWLRTFAFWLFMASASFAAWCERRPR